METTIDFAPLLAEYVLPAVAAFISALLMWLARKAAQFFDIKMDDSRSAIVHGVIDRGIALGQKRVAILASDHLKVDVRNAVAAQAAQYAIDRAPDALKRFGLNKEGLEDMIEAKMSELLVAEAKAQIEPPK